MPIKTFGFRREMPAYFDMACVRKPAGAKWYGNGFRAGDRAAAYVYMLDWRQRNPNRKLTVLDSPYTKFAITDLDAMWMCKDFADKVWCKVPQLSPTQDLGVNLSLLCKGERLYNRSLWLIWRELRVRCKDLPKPTIRPDMKQEGVLNRWMDANNIGSCYVTLQPLCDVSYNTYRNAPMGWWQEIRKKLIGKGITVFMLGSHLSRLNMCKYDHFQTAESRNLIHPTLSASSCEESKHISMMISLIAISKACVHIGGETGLTLWAPILGIPTVAVYKFWGSMNHMDSRPIPFGSPVEYCQLNGSTDAVVSKVEELMLSKSH